MDLAPTVAFWAVTAVLIAVPGADWAFVVGAAVRGRGVVPAVGGLVVGYSGLTVVVAAGVGAAVAASPATLTGLTVAGGLYLVWHGATTLARPGTPTPTHTPAPTAEPERAPADRHRDVLLQGVGVSGLNPKGLLIFLALLPQFTRPHAALPLAGQIAVLGLVFTATCAAFYLALGSFASTVLRARPAAARAVARVSGTAMVVIGIVLIAERLLG